MSLQKKLKYIYNESGKKTDVIIPIERYERLIEDLADLEYVEAGRKEKRIPLSEIKKRKKK